MTKSMKIINISTSPAHHLPGYRFSKALTQIVKLRDDFLL